MVGAALVAAGEDVEEQLASGAVEGDEAELVADQDVNPVELLLEAAQLPMVASFDQIADEIGGLAEPDSAAALAGLDAERDRLGPPRQDQATGVRAEGGSLSARWVAQSPSDAST